MTAGLLLAAAGITAAEPGYLFFNVVPCSIGEEQRQAKNMIELEKRTGIDIALYSLTLHPEGAPASRKADHLIESYRKFSRALAGSAVRPGILLQSILGHRVSAAKMNEPWTRVVSTSGRNIRFCPLDPGFRKYIFDTVAALAKENPCFILGDDDIRGFSGKGAECFCKLHTAEFNRRTGRDFTPEQYLRAVSESKIGDPVFTAFEQLRRDTVLGVCKLIRQAIDSVDPSIPAGVCSPGWELQYYNAAAKAIAAKGQPAVQRIASGFYMEQTALELPWNHLFSLGQVEAYRDIPILLDEADTCPHSLFSKSAQTFHEKICSAIFAGLKGSKIWYVNGSRGEFRINPKYTEILEKYRNFYPELARTVRGSSQQGIIIPLHRQFIQWHPAGKQNEYFTPAESWVKNALGVYGIPFRASFDYGLDGIYAIAGESTVARFTDDELKQLLSRRVLVDGPAAVALTKRGFSDWLGVRAEQREFTYDREASADGKHRYPISLNPKVPFLELTSPKAEAVTFLRLAPDRYARNSKAVCPGCVIYRNPAGGTVCTTAYHNQILWVWARDERKAWLLMVLDRLNGGRIPYAAGDDQWIMLHHRRLASGEDVLGFFNLGYDPLEKITLRCAAEPGRTELLTPQGQWIPVEARWQSGRLTVPVRLESNAMAVLKLTGRKTVDKTGNKK